MNTHFPEFASITADQLGLVKPGGGCCHTGPNTHPRRNPTARKHAHNVPVATFHRLTTTFSLDVGAHFIPAAAVTPINTHKADILLRFSPIHF